MGWLQRTAGAEEQEKDAAQEGLSSPYLIKDRMMDVLDVALKKCQATDVSFNELSFAMLAYMNGTGTAAFQQQRLLGTEKAVQEDPSTLEPPLPRDSEEMKALFPMFRLAELAYEPETEELKTKLKEEGYELNLHNTDVKAAESVGYYVAVDDENKVLLIGVKGTSSLADAITDCVAITMPHQCTPYCPFTGEEKAELGREIRCHEGILLAALKLCDDIYDTVTSIALEKGYKIRITGHSLGAGTSALLGMLLRARGSEKIREPGFLHVWAFACPAVADMVSSRDSKHFITSIVCKSDVVPRLSMANVEVLIKTLNGIAYKIKDETGSGQTVYSGYFKMKNEMNKKIQEAGKEGKEVFPPISLEEMVDMVNNSQAGVDIEDRDHLYVPGRVIFFYDTMDQSALEMPTAERKKHVHAAVVDGCHKVSCLV
jgi:Lipase (class 3)